MSASAKTRVLQQLNRVLASWPKDPLRPECQLQDVLGKRIAARASADPRAGLRQLNALASLARNRFQKRHALAGDAAAVVVGGLMAPASDPGYYARLRAELDAAPTRTWLDRVRNRVVGMFRVR